MASVEPCIKSLVSFIKKKINYNEIIIALFLKWKLQQAIIKAQWGRIHGALC